MKIGVIGAGAIGLLFAFHLGQTNQVTLYTRTREQAQLLQSEGIHLINGEVTRSRPIHAVPVESWRGTEDITFISVKHYQLQSILSILDRGPKDSGSLIFLQNGMGHLRWLSTLTASRIYLGSVEHGVARMNGNTVLHNGHGKTRFAVYKGSDDHLKLLVASTPNDFNLTIESDYYEVLVNKLIVNAVINPLTAAFHVTNGQLLKNPYYHQIAIDVFEEVAVILEIKNKRDQLQNVLTVCKNTSTNRSSMLKDIEVGRETEIDAILGYLIEEANSKKVDAPLIRNYYNLIKGIELQGEGSS